MSGNLKPEIEREIQDFIAYLDEQCGGEVKDFIWLTEVVRERLARAVIAHPDNTYTR